MITLTSHTLALSLLLMILLCIFAFILVLFSLKESIARSRSIRLYKLYFVTTIFGWGILGVYEILFEHIDLVPIAPAYALATFLFYLAFTSDPVNSKGSIFIITLSLILGSVSILSPNNFDILLAISIYALMSAAYLLYLGIRKSLHSNNVGHIIMSLGFVIIILGTSVQLYYLLNLNDLSTAYAIAKGNASIGFILLGIGLLSSILITEHKYLLSISLKDPLTNMNNRRGLDYLLGAIIPSMIRNKKTMSAIAIDIDFFKKINDSYGHDGGDEVLKAFAQMLQTCPRASDLSSRLGGEEFVVILPDTSLEGALIVAEKIRDNAEQLRIPYDEKVIQLTASFGVASQEDYLDTDALLKNADKALYQAKQEGRNRVCHYDN